MNVLCNSWVLLISIWLKTHKHLNNSKINSQISRENIWIIGEMFLYLHENERDNALKIRIVSKNTQTFTQ